MKMMTKIAEDADDFVDDANDEDDADDDDDDDDDNDDDDDGAYVLVLRSRNPGAQEWPWRLHLVSTKHLPFSIFNS